ncbi:MAG: DUF4296 domain-containing protein [Bacteroidota bacterium]
MLRKICFFIVLILLLSCHSKKQTTQPDFGKILDHHQMTEVLVDFYLIEANLANGVQDEAYLKQYTSHYYRYFYKKHKINRQQFIISMEYYCFHTKELTQIYNDVITHLAAMQSPALKQ